MHYGLIYEKVNGLVFILTKKNSCEGIFRNVGSNFYFLSLSIIASSIVVLALTISFVVSFGMVIDST